MVGIVGSNSNIAPYNIYVQGEKPVRMFRQAGWKGVDELAKVLENELDQRVDAILDSIVR